MQRASTSELVETWVTLIGDADAVATVRGPTPSDDLTPIATASGLGLGPVLGQGGMGLVRSARQASLDREVAVKTLRPDVPRGAARKLLEEARLTGALDHPNIVPVYDVCEGDDGAPLVVLKRLDGAPWSELLYGAGPTEQPDPIAWHLGVLVTVCHAVEYAHRRGIVHRDLKPENVMIGHFGEVWVLDWGIAVCLSDAEAGRFPLARDQRHLVGTPAFLAPEMLTGDGAAIRETTDVYLLGGLLYCVLAGRPPHAGGTLREVLASVERGPVIDPGWPADLRALLGSAFDPDPERRPTVRAFREALQGHLAARDSARLREHALDSVRELVALLGAPEPAERLAVYDRYGACRFGLREASARWPSDSALREAREVAARAMVGFELSAGDARAARVLLADLPEPDAGLAARVDALDAEQAAAREKLRRLQRDVDPATAFGARLAVLLPLAVVWVLLSPMLSLVGVAPSYPRALGVGLFQLALASVALLITSRWMVASRLNRALFALLLLAPVFAIATTLSGWWWSLPLDQMATLDLLLYSALLIVAALLVDAWMLPSGLFFLAAFGVAVVWPDASRAVTSLSSAFLAVNAALAWGALGLRKRDARPLV